jgi:hypothetical protein
MNQNELNNNKNNNEIIYNKQLNQLNEIITPSENKNEEKNNKIENLKSNKVTRLKNSKKKNLKIKNNIDLEKEEEENLKENEKKNKTLRIKKIIEDSKKDEKKVNYLKEKLGEDFLEKLTTGDITEEYLSQVENNLTEYQENEINNLKVSNNSSFQMRKSYKINSKFIPKRKFKNYNENSNYNKMILKKQITDHLYHYKEFPHG